NIALNEKSPSKIYYVSDSWQQQPQELRSAMPKEPNATNHLYRINIPKNNNTEELSSWIVYKFENDLKTKYVSFVNNPSADLSNYRLLAPTRVAILLVSTAVILLLFIFFMLWFIFKTMDKPISALRDWANSLTIQDLNKPIPNFVYPELNGFAELLHHNMKAISQVNERERQFLAYTSHELRTPLSIIISNTEILKYILNQCDMHDNQKLQQSITRLEKSTYQMQGMTQAILWLDRGSESINLEDVQLDQLTEEVIQQNISIIQNNPQIQLTTSLEPSSIQTYHFPLQIVLNNIIKNAFQHTLTGSITIHLTPNYLEVENTLTESKYGFGVGLELTRRLAEKLGFNYIIQESDDKFYSKLIFSR
ncbi:MAG: HAMP domain-containing histidine kinase, partial [Neisseriaceae bacterium]|nr:HAMP domain-containing histidine kinase [Neisseriaceae bacterium]